MIQLTRLNGDRFILNADLIRYVESRPDTYITLISDERIIVRETSDEVVRKSIDYARKIRFVPGLGRGPGGLAPDFPGQGSE